MAGETHTSEPGLWAVVEAGVKQHDLRLRWINLGEGIRIRRHNWHPADDNEYDRAWSDLIDPVVLRGEVEL